MEADRVLTPPSSSLYTIQGVTGSTYKETEPLLRGQNDIESEPDSRVVNKKCISKDTLKTFLTAVCLWLAYLFVSADYSLLAPFFPGEAESKGASSSVVGIIVSSSPLCVVFFSPIFGYFLPRLGLRFTLLSGVLLVGGAFVLLGFVSSPQITSGWMFIFFCILLRVTEGIGSSMFFTATFALLPEMFPNHIGTAMGLFEVGAGLGYSIGPPLGGLLYQVGGFELPFHVVGGLTLLFIVPIFFLVKSSDCKSQTVSWKVIRMLASNLIFIILMIANTLALASIAFLTPTLEPFLKLHQPSIDPVHIGLVFLSGPLAYMLFSIVVGPLSDKLGSRYFIIGGLLLFGFGYFFLGPADFISTPQVWITVVAFVVVGIGASFGMVPIYADMLAIGKRLSPSDVDSEALTSVMSGVVSSTLSLGEFLGPILSGGLTQYFDFQTSCVLFGEVILAEGLLLLGVTVIGRVLNRTNKQ